MAVVVLVFIVVPVAAVVLVFIVVSTAAVVLVFIVVPVVLVCTVIPAKAGIPRPASDAYSWEYPPAQGHWLHSQDGSWRARPDSRLRGNDVGMCGNDVGVLRE